MLSDVKYHCFKLVPESDEMKQGKVAIEFAISKEGRVANMCLVAISGDVALDRAAWNGITSSNPFPPLPTDFTGRCGFVFTRQLKEIRKLYRHRQFDFLEF